MRYIDFVNLDYDPSEEDVICDFYVKSQDNSLKDVAGGIAAESSIGTWTSLTTLKPYVMTLKATVFQIDGNKIRIAYPVELFEQGNMPNILSSLAGNVFGLDTIKHLRLNDIHLSKALVRSFKGPRYGIGGVRQLLGVKTRPFLGTIIKPKLGLSSKDHAKVAYDAWIGGCDFVKDDENLASQRFNLFEHRVLETLKMRDRAEKETGETKAYLINITAETEKMIDRTKFVQEHGGRYVMVDIITCGFSALQTLRNMDLPLIIHAHRAGHATFTRLQNHGINMRVIAKIARIIGVDQIHIGTAVGKMSEKTDEVLENIKAIKQPMYGLKPVLPVASGGLHPRLVPLLLDIFGKDFVIQAGGGIHGHPAGSMKGATAMRQAVDAVTKGLTLDKYAEDHNELAVALQTWR